MSPDPDAVFAPLPRAVVEGCAEPDDTPPRHVVHLPITIAGTDEAVRFAYILARSLASIPGVEVAGATVSAEDAQHVRRWVFCDLVMPDRRRCLRAAGHDGRCAPGGQ
ncbi:hypothetical protein AB0H28_26260 [Micromonospora sp. NPDC050980]|uniref:hypothetical protein n=1 Tax=Micromonospora sp. NPDC050980 TaxID=3155161 RepID=UPI0033D301F9